MKLWTNSRAGSAFCQRRHQHAYTEGWRRRAKHNEEPLYFGDLFHKGLEAWWGVLKAYQDDRAAWGDTFGEEKPLTRVMGEQMWCAVKGRARNEVDQVLIEELLLNYHRRWAPTCEDWRVISVEQCWHAPMINPETGAASRTWVVAGKTDVVARYIPREQTMLVEHKTTIDEIDGDTCDYWRKLRIDPQVSTYWYGATVGGALELDGVLYDVVRKAQIRPRKIGSPRRKKAETDEEWAAREAVEGRLETMSEFRARLRDYYTEKGAAWVVRKSIQRTEDEIREWMYDTWANAKRAHECERTGMAPRNAQACQQWNRLCRFYDQCTLGAILREDDVWEREPEWPHPELERDHFQEVLTDGEHADNGQRGDEQTE